MSDNEMPFIGTVLVIESTPQFAALLGIFLPMSAANVISVADCADAFEAAKDAAVVFVDLHLGGETDGLSVVRAIRRLTDVPIVMVGGDEHGDAETAAVEAGADGYVRKPISITRLMKSVREAFTQRGEKR